MGWCHCRGDTPSPSTGWHHGRGIPPLWADIMKGGCPLCGLASWKEGYPLSDVLSPLLGQPFGPIRGLFLDHVTLLICILTLNGLHHNPNPKISRETKVNVEKNLCFQKILIFILGTWWNTATWSSCAIIQRVFIVWASQIPSVQTPRGVRTSTCCYQWIPLVNSIAWKCMMFCIKEHPIHGKIYKGRKEGSVSWDIWSDHADHNGVQWEGR